MPPSFRAQHDSSRPPPVANDELELRGSKRNTVKRVDRGGKDQAGMPDDDALKRRACLSDQMVSCVGLRDVPWARALACPGEAPPASPA